MIAFWAVPRASWCCPMLFWINLLMNYELPKNVHTRAKGLSRRHELPPSLDALHYSQNPRPPSRNRSKELPAADLKATPEPSPTLTVPTRMTLSSSSRCAMIGALKRSQSDLPR